MGACNVSEKTMRKAQVSDAADLLKIYQPYVRDTVFTFECDLPMVDEFERRIENITSDYPYIVCMLDDRIAGYAYAYQHMEQAAYQWNAELSIYVDRACLRYGIGKSLYLALIDILRLQGVMNVYACVTSSNENSERLHESLGFQRVGTFHRTGYKLGAWHDVTWFEQCLGTPTSQPQTFRSIRDIDDSDIMDILKRYD